MKSPYASNKVQPRRPAMRMAAPRQLCNLDRLFARMEAVQLDGLVAFYATNQYYLSSYARHSTIPEEVGMFPVVISRHEPDHPVLCMADVDLRRLSVQPTWIRDIRAYSTVLPFDVAPTRAELHRFVPKEILGDTRVGLSERVTYEAGMAAAVTQALRDLGLTWGNVGFDNLGIGQALASAFPKMKALPAEGHFRYIRQQKTPVEVELLRHATMINQTAQERAIRQWAPGMTVRDLTFAFQVEALALGGQPNLPDTFQMANPPGIDRSLHSDPEVIDHELTQGMHVMFDCHGKYNGYCWDGGKTWLVDAESSPTTAKNWEATMTCLAEINAAMRPGRKMSDLVEAGRRGYRRSGVSDDGVLIYFHGLGLDHVDQDIGSGEKDCRIEKDSMLSTHIYYPGGAEERLFVEDIVFVRETGIDRLFNWDNSLF